MSRSLALSAAVIACIACRGVETVRSARAEGRAAEGKGNDSAPPAASADALKPVASPISKLSTLPQRTRGLAPLGVVLDALDPDWGVDRPANGDVMRVDYAWDFGDPESGKWTSDGSSRNQDFGFIAAHVYERPGRYNVRLVVTQESGKSREYSRVIEVEAFSGATYHVSNSGGDDARDGSSAATAWKSFERAMGAAGPNVRILFKRGDAWQVAEGARLTAPGPLLIGAYGTGAAPKITVTGDKVAFDVRARDVRITELALVGPDGSTRQAIAGTTDGGTLDLLVSRVEISRFQGGVSWSKYRNHRHLNVVIADNHIHDIIGNGAYVGGEHLAVIGNRIERIKDSHVLRVWQAHRAVISHNLLSQPGDHHALKLHGPNNDMPYAPTQFAVVSQNQFRGKTWVVGIGAENARSDQRLSDILFERNRVSSVVDTRVGLLVWAQRVMVRNNVFDGTDSEHGFRGVVIEQRGIEPPPRDIRVFHNTIVRDDKRGKELVAFTVEEDAADTQVVNNLVYGRDRAAVELFAGDGQAEIIAANAVVDRSAFEHVAGGKLKPVANAKLGAPALVIPGQQRDFTGRLKSAAAPNVGALQR